MGANSNKVILLSALACAAAGVGAWQANAYFAERKPQDASAPQRGSQGGERRTTKALPGSAADSEKGATTGSEPPSGQNAATQPQIPTEFVKIPSMPDSAALFEDFKPKVAQAVKAHAELGQSSGAAQNALVAAAVDALEKILGVNGTPMDVMGERAPAPAADGTAAPAAPPPPQRAERMAGMEALLKDASIDPSRATVEFFPDGAMGMPKRAKPAPGEERSGFQATMRMSGRMMSTEKVPTVEVRIPAKIKDSPSPGDDLDIGVMLERDGSGEKWTPAGFNLHMKKPEIMKKLSGSMPSGGRRQAPQAAPGGDK